MVKLDRRRAWSHRVGAALAVGILALPAAALAAPPPQAAVCMACHGADGLGNQAAGYPALAGLGASYIAQQLYNYKHGARQNPMMSAMAASLGAAQRAALATYYAAMTVPAKPEPAALPAGDGASLAVNGDWHQQLNGEPACDSCHGPYGIGVGEAFPRLAGQPKAYLVAQMVAWQKGGRTGDPLQLMHAVATKLTAPQIDAVSAWYAALAANPTALPGLDGPAQSSVEGGK